MGTETHLDFLFKGSFPLTQSKGEALLGGLSFFLSSLPPQEKGRISSQLSLSIEEYISFSKEKKLVFEKEIEENSTYITEGTFYKEGRVMSAIIKKKLDEIELKASMQGEGSPEWIANNTSRKEAEEAKLPFLGFSDDTIYRASVEGEETSALREPTTNSIPLLPSEEEPLLSETAFFSDDEEESYISVMAASSQMQGEQSTSEL